MNALIALVGWLGWNIVIFRIDKDQHDDQKIDFPLKQYFLQSWDNWLSSLIMVPVLLYIGDRGLHLPGSIFGFDGDMAWSDLYYLGAGFFTEAIIWAIKKYKAARK